MEGKPLNTEQQTKLVELAGLRFGEGAPKLCVPMVAQDISALEREAAAISSLPADLCEWRLDHFSGEFQEGIALLRRMLPGTPLLCTVRTRHDGGLFDGAPEEYEQVLLTMLQQGGFELLDVELSCGEDRVKSLAKAARAQGVGIIVSSHDFAKTPDESEMVSTLLKMKALGADLPKLAVMPQSAQDVLALLSATLQASQEIGPVVTMAMGALGVSSRVVGQLFGSCMTFGAGQAASAPGQLGAEDLRLILQKLDVNTEQTESGATQYEK